MSRNPDAKKSRTNVSARAERIRVLTLLGATRQEIADELDIATATVSRVRRKLGMQIRNPGPYAEEVFDRALTLLDDGASYAEVARTLGVSAWSIAHRFPGRGWTQHQRLEYLRAIGAHDPNYAWLRNSKGGVWGHRRYREPTSGGER